MGGILGKDKLCVFPRRVAFCKAKGKKTSGTARVFCDASTWTGESHFYSARIGRTPRAPEPFLAVSDSSDVPEGESARQAQKDTGDQAAPLCVRSEAPLTISAGDARDSEVPWGPETKPNTEMMMMNQQLAEQAKQEALSATSSLQEISKTQTAEHPAGGCVPQEQLGCEDDEAGPLPQATVKVDVHVCAEDQGEAGPDTVESGLPIPVEDDTVPCVSEESCEEKAHQEVPVEKAAESPAAPCTTEESELPLKTTETRESITNVQRSAEKQTEEKACCAAGAPADLQLEHDTEVPVNEYVEENALASEQAEETAEVGDDGQTSKEIPHCLTQAQAALQDEETIKASNEGKQPAEKEL